MTGTQLENSQKEKENELNCPWDFGYMDVLKKNSWVAETICTFRTVSEFWWLMNQTIAHKDFPQNTLPKELWIFRSGCTPIWTDAKKYANITELFDVSFDGGNKNDILHICLYCIGESIPYSDDILGIRVKQIGKKLSVRLWISSKNSAVVINKLILKELASSKLVSSIKIF